MAGSDSPGCLLGILKFLLPPANGAGAGPETTKLPYLKKDWFFSKAERSFYGVLLKAVDGQFHVFAKVRLLDLLYLPRGTQQQQTHRNRVQSKHVDFVLCDAVELRPMLVIELDDASHEEEERQDRDAFVDAALEQAGLPILRVTAKRVYQVEELRQAIRSQVTSTVTTHRR